MKTIFAAAAAAFAVIAALTGTPAQAQTAPSVLLDDSLFNSVKVGFATHIGGDKWITVFHEVSNRRHCRLVNPAQPSDQAGARVVFTDPSHDLAIVQSTSIGGNSPKFEESVSETGTLTAADRTFRKSGLRPVQYQDSTFDAVELTPIEHSEFSHGASGTPVLSSNGAIAGIVDYVTTEGKNGMVPAKAVIDFITKTIGKPEVSDDSASPLVRRLECS